MCINEGSAYFTLILDIKLIDVIYISIKIGL